MKTFRKENGLRALSFASADDLQAYLGLTPGAVTPLGLLHDADHAVQFYLDEDFLGHKIGVHPNDNTATVWLAAGDLVRLLQDFGTDVHIVSIGGNHAD